MSLDSLAQLQELALTDAALRQALDAVSSSADLLGLARLHNLTLSESSAQSWLESRSSQAPSAEMLASLQDQGFTNLRRRLLTSGISQLITATCGLPE